MKIGILFGLLWLILGNPFIAILVLLLLIYVLDRSFFGFFPSVTKPLQRRRRLAKALMEIRERPFDVSAKREAARLYMEKKQWQEARRLLEEVAPVMENSAEVLCELGICRLKTGELEQGERDIEAALSMNPRVRYGEPHLRLGEALAPIDPKRALAALERFKDANSSSCELYFRLGRLYETLDRKNEARASYREAMEVYRALPRYKRRSERRWAMLASVRNTVLR